MPPSPEFVENLGADRMHVRLVWVASPETASMSRHTITRTLRSPATEGEFAWEQTKRQGAAEDWLAGLIA
jgi:hypothetical protein